MDGDPYRPRLGAPSSGVVVTGGASGLGLASARALAAVGRPVAIWDLDAAAAIAVADQLARDYGVAAIGLGIDLRDATGISAAVAASRAALPSIGGLVHCAGTCPVTGLEGVTPDGWDAGLALHARAVVLVVQALLPDLKTNPGSAVVALSSINATLGSGLIPIYSAAKGAVLSLVRSMADALAPHGIRINAVSPGMIDTPPMRKVIDALPAGQFERRILLGRSGQPEEIGRLVRFLMSDEASYVTAAEFVADGGNLSSSR